MSNLVSSVGGLEPTRIERRTNVVLERVRADQTIAAAREVARVQVIEEVASWALLSCSNISALEDVLIARTPRAEERLRHIADAAALGLTEVVLATNRRVR